jgi:hypothetical protein
MSIGRDVRGPGLVVSGGRILIVGIAEGRGRSRVSRKLATVVAIDVHGVVDVREGCGFFKIDFSGIEGCFRGGEGVL